MIIIKLFQKEFNQQFSQFHLINLPDLKRKRNQFFLSIISVNVSQGPSDGRTPGQINRTFKIMGHVLAQSASLQAHRMTGGNSGWSAPPEVFREKSLLEIEQEKKSKMNQPKKNKTAPKMDES